MTITPAAIAQSFKVNPNGQSIPPAPGILEGDTYDADTIITYGDSLKSFQTAGSGQPATTHQGGSVLVDRDGSFQYTPPGGGLGGADFFRYRLTNGSVSSAVALVTLLSGLPPQAQPSTYNALAGLALLVQAPGVLQNGTLNDGRIVRCGPRGLMQPNVGQPVQTVQNGSVTLYSDGSFSYTPDQGFTGGDSFTYVLENADGASMATVTLNVSAVYVFDREGNVMPPLNASGWQAITSVNATQQGSPNPAVVFLGRLFAFWSTGSGISYASTADGVTWSPLSAISAAPSSAINPSAVVLDGVLYVFYNTVVGHQNMGGALYDIEGASSSDGETWTPMSGIALGSQTTGSGISVAAFLGRLYLFYQHEVDFALHCDTISNLSTVQTTTVIPAIGGTPSAVVAGTTLHLFYLGPGNKLMWVTSADGTNWSSPVTIQYGGAPQLPDSPCGVVAGGEVYVFYHDAFTIQGTNMFYCGATTQGLGKVLGSQSFPRAIAFP